MKKKLMSIMLVIVLTLFSTSYAYADVVSDDASVLAAYNAYLGVKDGMSAADYDQLYDSFTVYVSTVNTFTEAQEEEWNRIVAEKFGVDEALSCLINAAFIVNAESLMQMYSQTPNAKTAYDFVSVYDECIELELPLDQMIPTMNSVYELAKADLPSANTLALYDAYLLVVNTLEFGSPEELDPAIEAFNKVVDIYNELTIDEFDDLALLLELTSEDPELTDGEYISQIVFADWMNINILDSIDKVYSDYVDEQNMENAEALIEFYELLNLENPEEEVISSELVDFFFPDLSDVYQNAVDFLAESKLPTDTDDEDNEDDWEDKNDNDDNNEDKDDIEDNEDNDIDDKDKIENIKDNEDIENNDDKEDKLDKTDTENKDEVSDADEEDEMNNDKVTSENNKSDTAPGSDNSKDSENTNTPQTGDVHSVQLLVVMMFGALFFAIRQLKKERA